MAYNTSFAVSKNNNNNFIIPIYSSSNENIGISKLLIENPPSMKENNYPGEILNNKVLLKNIGKKEKETKKLSVNNYRTHLLKQSGLQLKLNTKNRDVNLYNNINIPSQTTEKQYITIINKNSFSGESMSVNLINEEIIKPKKKQK
jgi:hypothetical protein